MCRKVVASIPKNSATGRHRCLSAARSARRTSLTSPEVAPKEESDSSAETVATAPVCLGTVGGQEAALSRCWGNAFSPASAGVAGVRAVQPQARRRHALRVRDVRARARCKRRQGEKERSLTQLSLSDREDPPDPPATLIGRCCAPKVGWVWLWVHADGEPPDGVCSLGTRWATGLCRRCPPPRLLCTRSCSIWSWCVYTSLLPSCSVRVGCWI